MISTSSIPYITQMLNEPQSLSEADQDSIRSLLDAYPYFLPARYMEAALQHKKQPFAQQMMTRMQLYTGNWILLWQYLEGAAGEDAQAKYYEAQAIKEQQQEMEEEIEEIAEEHEIEKEYAIPLMEDENNAEEQVPENDDFIFERFRNFSNNPITAETDETLILPVYTDDYFLHQGLNISNDIPEDVATLKNEPIDDDKSLMIVMSFSEWLIYFKRKNDHEREEAEDQKAVKAMWQKGKLAAALEEEDDEIPESVFEMAVNSITREDDLASESLAEIYIKQGKYDKAIEMYRKLSLLNPQKNAYFARKIDAIYKVKPL